ncbi:MAG: endonuclease III [Desulfuromonadaceae bacterium]|nr:endonuclease III [Desulfuromonadaceae bacterium]
MRTRKERAAYVAQKLDQLYPEIPIPLDHSDAYTLLIAVLLSAQCTDARVNLVTPALFSRADTPQRMAQLSVEEIKNCIATCGLANSKAKNIRRLSEMLVEKYGGEVPRTFEQLEELPGVGHKTASVVMIHAFKIPAFPVDTHIHRLAQRWGLTRGKNVEQTEADCKKLWPAEQWEKLHLQIITYGREYCTARGCDGTRCEICRTTYPNRKKPFIANKA